MVLGTALRILRTRLRFVPMQHASRVNSAVIAAAAGFTLWSTPASAYLDPGEGSMLAQAMFAATVGSVVGLRLYWRKITGFLRSKKIRD